MAGRKNSTFAVTKVRLGDGLQVDTRADIIAGEEPLEIRAGGQTITTTMRTLAMTLSWRMGSCIQRAILLRLATSPRPATAPAPPSTA